MILACVAPRVPLQAALPSAEDWLSAPERARCQAFSLPARRRLFLAGRWLARQVLAQAGGHADRGWQVSVSHSGAWVAAAVAPPGAAGVGIDIEARDLTRDWAALAAFIGWTDCADADDFYRRWTLGEAWVKAHGSSLPAARALRWVPQAAGSAWQGCDADRHLHAAVVGAEPLHWWPWPGEAAPQWTAAGRFLESTVC